MKVFAAAILSIAALAVPLQSVQLAQEEEIVAKPEIKKIVEEVFPKLDADGDGILELTEFQEVLRKWGADEEEIS